MEHKYCVAVGTLPGCSEACFAGDSQVLVPGGVKYIKDLKVGDKEEEYAD